VLSENLLEDLPPLLFGVGQEVPLVLRACRVLAQHESEESKEAEKRRFFFRAFCATPCCRALTGSA
jgi:hypothetical protein